MTKTAKSANNTDPNAVSIPCGSDQEACRLPTVQECMEELDRDIWQARTRPDDYCEQTRIILEAQRHYLQRVIELEKALEKISSQAVCVNMDGDEGNERMLKYIMEIADNAIAATSR